MSDHIQFFEDTDQMFQAIELGVQRAKAAATPHQNEITYGNYWMRSWEDLIIFGRVSTIEELDADERRLGASESEIEYEHALMQRSYENGFRFGRAFSVVMPGGELGDTHVSTMIPITEEEFNLAKALNWMPEDIAIQPWFQMIIIRELDARGL